MAAGSSSSRSRITSGPLNAFNGDLLSNRTRSAGCVGRDQPSAPDCRSIECGVDLVWHAESLHPQHGCWTTLHARSDRLRGNVVAQSRFRGTGRRPNRRLPLYIPTICCGIDWVIGDDPERRRDRNLRAHIDARQKALRRRPAAKDSFWLRRDAWRSRDRGRAARTRYPAAGEPN